MALYQPIIGYNKDSNCLPLAAVAATLRGVPGCAECRVHTPVKLAIISITAQKQWAPTWAVSRTGPLQRPYFFYLRQGGYVFIVVS